MDFSECKNNTFFSIPQVFFLIFSFTDCVILIILTKALSIYGNVRVVMIFFNFSSVCPCLTIYNVIMKNQFTGANHYTLLIYALIAQKFNSNVPNNSK